MHLRFDRNKRAMPDSVNSAFDKKFRLGTWGKRILVAGLIIGSLGLADNLKKENPFAGNKPEVTLITQGFTSGKTKEKKINKTGAVRTGIEKDEEKLAAGKTIEIQKAGISEAFEKGIKAIGKMLKFAFEMAKVAFFLVGILLWGIIKLALDLVKFLFSNGLEILKDIGKTLWYFAEETWIGRIVVGVLGLRTLAFVGASIKVLSTSIKLKGIDRKLERYAQPDRSTLDQAEEQEHRRLLEERSKLIPPPTDKGGGASPF